MSYSFATQCHFDIEKRWILQVVWSAFIFGSPHTHITLSLLFEVEYHKWFVCLCISRLMWPIEKPFTNSIHLYAGLHAHRMRARSRLTYARHSLREPVARRPHFVHVCRSAHRYSNGENQTRMKQARRHLHGISDRSIQPMQGKRLHSGINSHGHGAESVRERTTRYTNTPMWYGVGLHCVWVRTAQAD